MLARIHRLTLGRLRREIEPVTAADFMRFLFRWQHLAPGTQLHGVDGALQILKQLQGYEISAAAWEPDVLRRRVARYDPELLDTLCLSGEVMWGRLSPHPAFGNSRSASPGPTSAQFPVERSRSGGRRHVRPTRVAPVAFFLREDTGWLLASSHRDGEPTSEALSHPAREVLEMLGTRGASFMPELIRSTGRLPSEVEDGLWELVAAGLVTADGFDSLRALVDPKRRRGEGRFRSRRPRHAAGRWAILRPTLEIGRASGPSAVDSPSPEPQREVAEAAARQLLLRWGVVFHDLLARETVVPPWRDLLAALRRMEARGQIRGGRFVSGFLGEQFAQPGAIELLRSVRKTDSTGESLQVTAADPLNLVGIVTPGPRVSTLAGVVVDVLGQNTGNRELGTGHWELSSNV